jgi:hypothetical protein
MNILITILMCCSALAIIALALSGDAVIWRLPSYKRFKELVNTLEGASVVRVRGTTQPHELTLRLVGRRRIPEVFVTTVSITEAITIGDCFGAMFIKDESIDDAVTLVKINAWFVFLVSLFGVLIIVTENPAVVSQLQGAGFWDRVPLLTELMFQNHLILFAELVAILTSLIYLIHNVRLLRRLNRAFQR